MYTEAEAKQLQENAARGHGAIARRAEQRMREIMGDKQVDAFMKKVANMPTITVHGKLNDALKPLPSENFVDLHSMPAKKLRQVMHEGNPDHPEVLQFVIRVQPMGAPRMTRSDKWRNPRRPVVQRYFDYRDVIRNAVSEQRGGVIPAVPDEVRSRFYISMSPSWTKKEKARLVGQPHKLKPDRDNLEKGLLDSLFEEDCEIWKGSQEKFWCKEGDQRIEMEIIYH